jgi:Penicillinase repressor
MARKPSKGFTDRELEIMKVVWQMGEATVKEIQQRLPGDPHYNSVLTIIRVLERKGRLVHRRGLFRHFCRKGREVQRRHIKPGPGEGARLLRNPIADAQRGSEPVGAHRVDEASVIAEYVRESGDTMRELIMPVPVPRRRIEHSARREYPTEVFTPN